MSVWRWGLAMYLVFTVVACTLVYLGDAHDIPGGRWADDNEHLLFVLVPLATLLVLPGWTPVDGGNAGHMALVVAAAFMQVVVLYGVAQLVARPVRRPPPHS